MIDHTRRGWLVTISQAAVGLGVAGNIPGDAAETATLPPGVYRPSTDHLSHALMSAERFHPIPPGCPTDYVRPSTGPFEPLFFSASEFSGIRRLTQLMLADTSENAAVSQEVAEWIDLRVSSAEAVRKAAAALDPRYRDLALAYYGPARVREVENSNPANTCREGLGWLAAASQTQHSREFLALETEQQIALLDSISDQRPDRQAQNAGTRFFDLLKAETVRGFYTSRAGLKELDFKGNGFYARSPGCNSK
jgi:gluconate 2-dehydrogenase subunit 3-like protein